MPNLNRKRQFSLVYLRRKLIPIFAATVICTSAYSFDLSIHLQPSYEIIPDGFLNKGGAFSANIGFDITPVDIHGRDKLYTSPFFTYTGVPVNGFGLQTLLDGGLGFGYDYRINDRWSVFAEFDFGVWNFIDAKNFTDKGASGLLFAGKIGADFFIFPELSVTALVGYKSFFAKPKAFMNTVELGVGVRYSLSQGLFNPSKVEITESHFEPLFPVFYSHYEKNPFGSITFVNNSKNDIYDITVFVQISGYMTTPYKVKHLQGILQGESFEVPISAFLNENIIDLVQPKNTEMEVTITYSTIGKQEEVSYNIPITALSRNSMTWEDDARAAAFVSGKDATAQRFARQVQAIVKKQFRSDIPQNIQYAAALYGALKAFGINYVVDPSSAFTDNIGTAAIDFLQFPYQTLVYHGGDCDDLTILNCSLLEALGIDTALITVPGHIFMAFDSGLSVEQGRKKTANGFYIEHSGKIWVPLEITLSQDTFALAWSYGAREWKKAGKDANLIPVKDAWQKYLPISVPGADAAIDVPEGDVILKNFKEARYY